jgi:hypothetical protein
MLAAARSFEAALAADTLAVEVELTDGELSAERYETIREVDLDGVAATIGAARAPRGVGER